MWQKTEEPSEHLLSAPSMPWPWQLMNSLKLPVSHLHFQSSDIVIFCSPIAPSWWDFVSLHLNTLKDQSWNEFMGNTANPTQNLLSSLTFCQVVVFGVFVKKILSLLRQLLESTKILRVWLNFYIQSTWRSLWGVGGCSEPTCELRLWFGAALTLPGTKTPQAGRDWWSCTPRAQRGLVSPVTSSSTLGVLYKNK